MATLEQDMPKQREEAVDIMEYFSLLWWNKTLIIVIAVLAALATYIVSDMRFTPTFSSTTEIYIFEKSTGTATSAADLSLGLQIAPDCIELIRSRKVIEDAIERLGDNSYSYSYIRGCISVENTEETRILAITATTTNPEEAQRIANAVRISASEYIAQIMDLQAVNLIQEATFPTGSTSSNAKQNALYGFLGGLLAACVFVIVRNRMDDTIKTPEDVARYLDLSVLGTLPYHDKNGNAKKTSALLRKRNGSGSYGTEAGIK